MLQLRRAALPSNLRLVCIESSPTSSASGPMGIAPALLMSTSSLPNLSLDILTKRAKSSRLVTSVGRNATSPPDRSICASTACRRFLARAPRTTFAPRSARSWAIAARFHYWHLLLPPLYLRLPQHLHITETVC